MQAASSTFPTSNGLVLFEQHWLPDGTPKGDVVIVHGYAEHSGRYVHVGEYLSAHGYAVHAFDLRGHGRSEGPRVLVRSMNEYLDDLDAFLRRVRPKERALFIIGHSMGGTIVTLSQVTRAQEAHGIVLSGPSLTSTGVGGLMKRFVLLLGRFFPKVRLRQLDAATVSRDPAVVAAYDADPLVDRGKVHAGTAAAMFRAMKTIEKRMPHFHRPLLIMHGTGDQLASPEGSSALHDNVASQDKTLRLYEGLYHEIFNEPEREEVLAELTAWLDARTRGGCR